DLKKLMEPNIAQNARPVSLKKGALIIQVLHAPVYYELERFKGKILEKMQSEFGKDKVKRIQFRLG
ncbi:MAG: DciA family protein, partial [Verrucomicrobiota bacterium]